MSETRSEQSEKKRRVNGVARFRPVPSGEGPPPFIPFGPRPVPAVPFGRRTGERGEKA